MINILTHKPRQLEKAGCLKSNKQLKDSTLSLILPPLQLIESSLVLVSQCKIAKVSQEPYMLISVLVPDILTLPL